MRPRSVQGLTLAEILVAIMLATVLIVSVLVALTQMMASAQKSSDLASGTIIAERLMSEIVNNPDLDTRPPLEGLIQGSDGVTTFNYRTDVSHLDNSDTFLGTSFLVTVDVWWMVENPDQVRNRVGKLSTRLSRLVYRSKATPLP